MPHERFAISADHALVPDGASSVRAVSDVTVVVERGLIRAIGHDDVPDAHTIRLPPGGLLSAGFIDTHSHTLNGPLFRGRTEDRPRDGDGSLVYDVLMPVGDLAGRLLTPDETADIYTLGFHHALMSGTTTVLDIFRPDTTAMIAAARNTGIRLYAAPYIASESIIGCDPSGRPQAVPRDETVEVSTALRIHDEHDGGPDGRLRIGLGPHCTDTCSPELLVRLMAEAQDRGTILTIHAAQSRLEVRTIRRRYGVTPIRHLVDLGVCGPGVILGHAVFTTDEDLRILADTGTAVASCPATFANGGIHVDHRRFIEAGVPTGLGTDGSSVSMREELRTAGLLSKLRAGRAEASDASGLLATATNGGARVLGRDDIGGLRVGARADLVGLVLEPMARTWTRDPARSVVWDPTAARVDLVLIDGEVLIQDGEHATIDVPAVAARTTAAIERVWTHAAHQLGIEPSAVQGDEVRVDQDPPLDRPGA